MTERFVYYTHKDHDYILDTPKQWLDFIEMLGDALSTEEIVDLLNEQDQRITELENDVKHWKNGYLIVLQDNNEQYDKIEELKKENKYWLKTASHFDNISHKDRDYVKRIHKENKELKEEIAKFKEWEKYIGDVKREDLDRVFKMSIYEIAEAFNMKKEKYYENKMEELENE